MRTRHRVVALVALLVLTLAVPLPHGGGDGTPRFRINLSSQSLAFADEESGGGTWVSDPMRVQATTVGITWEPGDAPEGLAWVRSSTDGDEWSAWVPLSVDEVHAPDPGTAEAQGARPGSSPVFIGDDRYVQFRVEAEHAPTMQAELLDARPESSGLIERIPLPSLPGADAAVARPTIVPRTAWGADSCTRRDSSSASNASVLFVHHTATPHTYTSAAQARERIFNICSYHVNTLGWSDIGYNFVIDKFGNIYEARKGGIERAIIGAHTGGYNTGSIGVAFLGTHISEPPSAAARAAFVQLAAWKMEHHGIEPLARNTLNGKTFNALSGHRDASATTCPGNACYELLGTFRTQIATRIVGFEDIADSVHQADIIAIAAAGITRGCNPPVNDRFCPKDVVTREQMAAFLVRALGLTETSSAGTFTDVPAGSTFATDINRLATAGITRGCNPPTNTRFCPGDPVTRDQMAAFLVRALKLSETSRAGTFTDVPAGSTFATDINRLATAGITRGCNPPTNSRYCPDSSVTREQMATFLSRGTL